MDYVTIITAVITALGSGGAVVWYKTWSSHDLQEEDQEYSQAAELYGRRLEAVEARLDTQSDKIQRLQKRESRLAAEIRVLVTRIEMLLRRLGNYEDLTEAEWEGWVQTEVDLSGDE